MTLIRQLCKIGIYVLYIFSAKEKWTFLKFKDQNNPFCASRIFSMVSWQSNKMLHSNNDQCKDKQMNHRQQGKDYRVGFVVWNWTDFQKKSDTLRDFAVKFWNILFPRISISSIQFVCSRAVFKGLKPKIPKS